MGDELGALIKALTHDVEIIERRQAQKRIGEENMLRGMLYAFKCALGRAVLAQDGQDPSNTDTANRTAESYLRV
jgi:hypothetical protein